MGSVRPPCGRFQCWAQRAPKKSPQMPGDSMMGKGRGQWPGVQEGGPAAGPRSTGGSCLCLGGVGRGVQGRPGKPRQVGAPRPARRLEAHSVLLSLDCQGSDFRKSRSLAFGNFFKEANKVNLTLLQGVGGMELRSCVRSPHLTSPRSAAARPGPGGLREAGQGRLGWFWVLREQGGGVMSF